MRSIFSHFRDTDYILFVAARVVGIALRPLVILAASSYFHDDFADSFAILLTAIASSFIILTNDSHIDYYKHTFSEGHPDEKKSKDLINKYILHSVQHSTLFIIPALVMFYIWVENFQLTLLCAAILIFEKIYDEYQRFYVYRRDYKRWMANFSFRYGIPSVILLAIIVMGFTPSIVIYVSIYCLFFCVYILLVEKPNFENLSHLLIPKNDGLFSYIRIFIAKYAENSLWAISATNFFLVDRYLVNAGNGNIAEYVFLSNVFNIIVVAHIILYFTYARPDAIKKDCNLFQIFIKPQNTLMPLSYAFAALIIVSFFSAYFPALSEPDYTLLSGLAVLFFLQAVSLVFVDFIYWRVRRLKLFLVDLVLMAGLLISFEVYQIYSFQNLAVIVVWLMVCATIMRNVSYFFIYKLSEDQKI